MQVLIGEITTGLVAPGARLPREADLAAQHGVSRGVARECIRGLEERGLVTVKHGRGATVTPPAEWNMFDPDVLASLLQGDSSTRVLSEYLECRQILEVEAAGLAAERATGEDLAILSETFERMTRYAERARSNPAAERLYQEADIAFHRAVVLATENRALVRMTEPIHRALAAAVPALAHPEQRFERGLPEHKRILSAIAGRNGPEARAAMRDHLETVESYLAEFARRRVSVPSAASVESGSR